MKVFGTHIYLGMPDRGVSEAELARQHDIRPSDGPRAVLGGLLSVGQKSRRSILRGNQLGPANDRPEPPRNDPARMKMLARWTYRENRLWQGAKTSQVEARRRDGMDPASKTASAFDRIAGDPEVGPSGPLARRLVEREAREVRTHMYFTGMKHPSGGQWGASAYAVVASEPDDPPKLARVYLSKSDREAFGLHKDPSSAAGSKSWRSGEGVVIPSGHVLPSSSAPVEVTAASESFKHDFNSHRRLRQGLRIDTVIGSQQAARMLREVQTPSATDEFPQLAGRWAKYNHQPSLPAPVGDAAGPSSAGGGPVSAGTPRPSP